MHVLLIPSWYAIAENPQRGIFFKDQAKALHRAGVKVGVIFPEIRGISSLGWKRLISYRFQIESASPEGFPELCVRGWKIFFRRMEAWFFVKQSARLFAAYAAQYGQPDLIHAHGVLWGGSAARQIAATWNIPYVITEHSSALVQQSLPAWQYRTARRAFQQACARIAVSQMLKQVLQRKFAIHDFEVIPNLVEVAFFKAPERTPAIERFQFITISNLKREKGIDYLLYAYATAFGKDQRVRLLICGDGPERASLQRLAQQLGIAERVHFRGRCTREEIRQCLWQSHVLVHPSRYETFGVVLIEAMATGLPVIATQCGGPEEIVQPETGMLVEPGNVAALSAAMRQMYTAYDSWKKRRKYIREYAVKHFGEQYVVHRLVKVYSRCLKKIDAS